MYFGITYRLHVQLNVYYADIFSTLRGKSLDTVVRGPLLAMYFMHLVHYWI